MRTLIFLVGISLGWVQSAAAAVYINEVAWMGSDESYFCEWIELYNSGSESVSLENWALQIGDGPVKPFAEGELNSNSIAAGGYYVVERLVTSCPDPVPAADDALVAFGSIPNSNTTIRLFNDVEQEHPVDQIASGEDWIELGGDNETKETAQYTDSGWVTAAATPGQVNTRKQSVITTAVDEDSSQTDTSSASSAGQLSRGATATTISLAELAAKQEPLELTISYPTTVYVAQPVQFRAEVAGRSQVVRNSLRYNWNFGDLTTTASSAPTHQYDFPGEYVVSVQASYYEYEASEQRTVTVLPVKLSMNITADGHLQIHNMSPYEVDVSQYTLSTVPPITFPERSVITPRGTITVANAQLGTHAEAIQLHDTAGNLISDTESLANTEAPSVTQGQRVTPPPPPQVASTAQTVTNEVRTTTTNSTSTLPSAVTSTPVLAAHGVAPEPATPERQWLWYGLLAALVGVGVLTIFLTTTPTSPGEDDELVD